MKKVSKALFMSLCLIGLFIVLNPINSNADTYDPITFYSNYIDDMEFQGEEFENNPYKFQNPNNVIVISQYVPVVTTFFYVR